MNQECSMPQPSPEHDIIQKNVGVWDVQCRFFMAPDAPPMETTGMDTITAIGPFWNVGQFEAEFMGMPFKGASQLGYLPDEKCYVSTWIDAMSTFLFVLKGNFDDSGKILSLSGMAPNPADGTMVPQRVEHEFVDDDNHKMRMYMTLEQGEIKTFEMDYSRRG